MNREKEYWNNRYQIGNSGYGSYGEQLKKKLDWICPLDFNTVTEVGCGDFNFGKNILERHPSNYVGYDISNVVVDRNQLLYPRYRFITINENTPFEKSDLLLCVDVLFHVFEEEDVEKLLSKLESAWTKYLVVTAYERDEQKDNHVRIRKFDYKRFGEPLIREIVEEDGELYFYLFEKK